jgi:hypothetical protein
MFFSAITQSHVKITLAFAVQRVLQNFFILNNNVNIIENQVEDYHIIVSTSHY